MDPVLRAIAVYVFLLLVFRIAGKRTMAQTTPFEMILLLIISETTQQAMVDDDHSVTTAFLLIVTLIGLSVLLSVVKHRFPKVDRWLEGLPLCIVRDGRMLEEPMAKSRVDEADIVAAARAAHGVANMQGVKHAVVENDGTISIVPREPG
jgi:uncharacterized membrane protein YcaP (DUF421 family)